MNKKNAFFVTVQLQENTGLEMVSNDTSVLLAIDILSALFSVNLRQLYFWTLIGYDRFVLLTKM